MKKYFKAPELGNETSVFVRQDSEEQARAVFALYRGAYPTNPETGPLVKVGRLEGWTAFRGIPKDHEVVWTDFGPATEFTVHSASRSELITQFVNNMSAKGAVIELGGMRNNHPLLGSERYRKEPYAGWDIAKVVCTPEEVLPIFNAYRERGFKGYPLLSGSTWEEVEASAREPGDRIYGCMSFPALPDFYRLLARKTGKTIVVGNRSDPDSAGGFHSVSETRYEPDGSISHTNLPPTAV